MLAGLVSPSSGALRIGGRDVERLPSAVTGRRITYVGANAYHFVGSLRDNLLYGLKHRPLRPPASEQALSPAALAAARRAGNRSEERSVGKERVSTCIYPWSP